VFSTGNFIGAMIAPPLVAWLALHYHWQFSFVITGASGFVLLGVWLWFYHSPEYAARTASYGKDGGEAALENAKSRVSHFPTAPAAQVF
jgi:ACS family hexuronate transporter-like MFS transporter